MGFDSGLRKLLFDTLICFSRRDMFPNEETPNMLFKGIPFCEVPIVNIRVSRNNTIFSLTEANGMQLTYLFRLKYLNLSLIL